jgi:hypothetical protein
MVKRCGYKRDGWSRQVSAREREHFYAGVTQGSFRRLALISGTTSGLTSVSRLGNLGGRDKPRQKFETARIRNGRRIQAMTAMGEIY